MPGILTNNRKTGPTTPAVSITTLTYDFPAYTKAELGVYTIATDGTITKLVLTTGYTVTLGDAHADAGGTIELVVAANGTDQYVIYGESVDGSNFAFAGAKLDQVAIDNEFYMLREQIQELKEQLVRIPRFDKSVTDLLNDIVMPATAGGFLQLSTVGDPSTLVFATPTDITGVTTTPYTLTLLDDADAAAARLTLAVDSKVNTDANLAAHDVAGAHLNIVMLDEPVKLLTGAAETDVTATFTDVDITAHTGSDVARIAILRCGIAVSGHTSTSNVRALNMRENDKTPTQPYTLNLATDHANSGQEQRTIFVPLDSGEIFEYELTKTGWTGGTPVYTNTIFLEGYVI